MTQKERILRNIELKGHMEALRKSGMTYEEIGKEVGLTKQRVQMLIGSKNPSLAYVVTKERCVYSELRRYMNERGMSVAGLARLAFGDESRGHYEAVKSALKGGNSTKQIIDAILNATGLPYEVAFKKEGAEK